MRQEPKDSILLVPLLGKEKNSVFFVKMMRIDLVSAKITAFLTDHRDAKQDQKAETKEIKRNPSEVKYRSDFINLKVIARIFYGPILSLYPPLIPYRKEWAAEAYNRFACSESDCTCEVADPNKIRPDNIVNDWGKACFYNLFLCFIPCCFYCATVRTTATTSGTIACGVCFFAGAAKDGYDHLKRPKNVNLTPVDDYLELLSPVEARVETQQPKK